MTVTAEAPGKLFIAGEYAVVEAGSPSVVAAVDKCVTVTIDRCTRHGVIESEQYPDTVLAWKRANGVVTPSTKDHPFSFVVAAMKITEQFAHTYRRSPSYYRVSIASQLGDEDGTKFGLGSSAAVTVATVKAVCKYYDLPVTKEDVFKIAAMAHLDVQGNGSLGDIAASAYGGWIAYSSFDHEWLAKKRRTMSIARLLHTPWPGLTIEQLAPPKDMRLLIGWTGSPASTAHLVAKVAKARALNKEEYQAFLTASRDCVNRMIQGFRDKTTDVIEIELQRNRKILGRLAQFSHVPIETTALSRLCAIAENHGAAAKSSGAGGGDCGVVILHNGEEVDPLVKDWQAEGITALPLGVRDVTDLGE